VLYVQKDPESAWILEKRSKFQRILGDARAGRFGVLIVDRMNRFTRSEDLGEFMQVMTLLREAGVRVIFYMRDYDETPVGQFMQFVDAFVSSQEQANRRNQSLTGKRAKVLRDKCPNPGSWPPCGYVWTDATKSQLEFNPGQAGEVTAHLRRSLLYDEHPTERGVARRLDAEGVPSAREYHGVARPANLRPDGPRWTATTIHDMISNPIYWGGDENGMVPTFRWAKHNDETLIPAYAPAYVTVRKRRASMLA
jgi:hypothetical protein